MAGETTITIVGALCGAPELRFTPSGVACANFTIASNPRRYDKQKNEWVQEDALFMRCTAWREMAESCAESLEKGTRVIATGNLRQRSYDAKDGTKHTVFEMDVQEIGPSLLWATAKVARAQRGQGSAGQSSGHETRQRAAGAPADDPWATRPGAPSGPPF
jgi:single-strand DNA-binding protein